MYGPTLAAGISVALLISLAGCTTTKQTNTARTAAEQLPDVEQSINRSIR